MDIYPVKALTGRSLSGVKDRCTYCLLQHFWILYTQAASPVLFVQVSSGPFGVTLQDLGLRELVHKCQHSGYCYCCVISGPALLIHSHVAFLRIRETMAD